MHRTVPVADQLHQKNAGGRRYALFLLFCALTLNIVDRQIMAILQPSIKRDLGLTDTQLGLLIGLAFSLFYTTLGIPIARLADRWSRTRIITIAIAIWSLMTVLSGVATSYVWLFLARVGVGVGEAGGSPPSHSLIADLYAPQERATALGVYALGIPLGAVLAFVLGGIVDHYYGWRVAFMLVGGPGLLLALVIYLTLPEPTRGGADGALASPAAPLPVGRVIKYLWALRSFRNLAIASGLHSFVGVGVVTWLPSYLIRSHQLSSMETGMILAVLVGLFGGLGSLLGGIIADRAGQRNGQWYMWIPALALCLAVPLIATAYASSHLILACGLLAGIIFLGNLHIGSTFATAQGLAPLAVRSTAAAVLMFVNGIIALGIGPLVTGIISDALSAAFSSASLGYAIMITSAVAAIGGAWYYMLAARTLCDDLEYSQNSLSPEH